MSKKGIFSIASGGNKDSSTPEATDEGAVDSPFARDDNEAQAGGADEPFKMDGFGQQSDQDDAEQADTANDSPFKAVADSHDNYETAKANLEPQQDFAAVPAPFKPVVASFGEDSNAASSQDNQSAESGAEITSPSQVVIDQVPDVPPVTPAADQVSSSPVSHQKTSVSSGMQQLEIRAIFGVDHILDANEIIQRARSLSGIGTVAAVGGQEKKALSDFHTAVSTLGLGDPELMELNFGSGSVDFITEGDTTLAVLQQGPYAPGVQETLIIVARELNKLA